MGVHATAVTASQTCALVSSAGVQLLRALSSGSIVTLVLVCVSASIVAGGVMYLPRLSVCLSVHPCIANVLNTISWKVSNVFSPILQHWCILGQGWKLQLLGSKFKVTVCPTCCKMHVLALLTWYLENYWTELWISPNFELWCILGRGWTLQFLGSKGQRSRAWARAQQTGTHRALCCALSSNF